MSPCISGLVITCNGSHSLDAEEITVLLAVSTASRILTQHDHPSVTICRIPDCIMVAKSATPRYEEGLSTVALTSLEAQNQERSERTSAFISEYYITAAQKISLILQDNRVFHFLLVHTVCFTVSADFALLSSLLLFSFSSTICLSDSVSG